MVFDCIKRKPQKYIKGLSKIIKRAKIIGESIPVLTAISYRWYLVR